MYVVTYVLTYLRTYVCTYIHVRTYVRNLVEFLEVSLRDPDLMRYEPTSVPSGFCVINNDETSKVGLGCD